jgi:regulator of RNase E activity RraA
MKFLQRMTNRERARLIAPIVGQVVTIKMPRHEHPYDMSVTTGKVLVIARRLSGSAWKGTAYDVVFHCNSGQVVTFPLSRIVELEG